MPSDLPTLAVLAGGEGSRMGQPKGELRIDGMPILSWLHKRFAWPGPTLLVTAPGREHPPGCEQFTTEAVDLVPNQGPLRGVMTALMAITTPSVVITTIDMPGVSADQARWLIDRLDEHPDALGLMTRRDSLVEPFPSIFRRRAIDIVRANIEVRRMSVGRLSEHAGIVVLPAPGSWDWTNLNAPADLEAFARRMGSA